MLNQGGITKVEGTTQKQITSGNCLTLSCKVTATADKTFLPGQPLTGSLEARDTAFSAAATADGTSNAIGLLLHELSVLANGEANGQIVVAGGIDMSKIDTVTAALISTPVRTACNNITFFK